MKSCRWRRDEASGRAPGNSRKLEGPAGVTWRSVRDWERLLASGEGQLESAAGEGAVRTAGWRGAAYGRLGAAYVRLGAAAGPLRGRGRAAWGRGLLLEAGTPAKGQLPEDSPVADCVALARWLVDSSRVDLAAHSGNKNIGVTNCSESEVLLGRPEFAALARGVGSQL